MSFAERRAPGANIKKSPLYERAFCVPAGGRKRVFPLFGDSFGISREPYNISIHFGTIQNILCYINSVRRQNNFTIVHLYC
jgi:hypothetical protein